MRSFNASWMLALTLSIVSLPSFADTYSAKEGSVHANSNATLDASRQGETNSNKNATVDAAKSASTKSTKASTGPSLGSRARTITPVKGSAPESNYTKTAPRPSNYVKSSISAPSNYLKSKVLPTTSDSNYVSSKDNSQVIQNPSGTPPLITNLRIGDPIATPGSRPSDYDRGTESNYVTGSDGTRRKSLAGKPITEKPVSDQQLIRNWD